MKKKQQFSRGKNNTEGKGEFKGVLDITRSGIGFVVLKDEDDIFVRPNDFGNAFDGDTVIAEVTKQSGRSGKREGRVIKVLKRRQTEFIGIIEVSEHYAFFVAETDKTIPDFYIPKDKLNNAKDKDRVLARITNWERTSRKPEGEIVLIVTEDYESDIAMKEILIQNGFPLTFDEDVLEESERLSDIISQSEIEKRRDMRDILTFTIDPVDAKDFDDAISIRKLESGLYEIGVHIADVSHYVKPGTLLDDEGYKRATSVYLPDRVNPMLPERISNELCSLRPKEDKLTFSAVFTMTEIGQVKEHWLGKTVTHSNHRFSYEDVQDIIEKKEGSYQEEILLLNDIAQRFRAERFKKGAINFSSTEVRFQLDEKGKPIGIVVKESKEAHQLIEELMLLANRTVAEFVSKQKVDKKDIPFPYRIHDSPDEDKLTPFISFAAKYGHKFDISSPEKISKSFNQMLQDVKGKPEQHVLEQLGIRTMAKAVYSTENIGHYGLAFEYYCHFTSPIRRYPDVMVHRVLESLLEGKPMIDKKMEDKSRHCSELERSAMECERAGNKYKQVEFMKEKVGEEFLAVVSGVSGFGFFAETVEHKCEGLVTSASLSDYDEFRLIEEDYSLAGRRSGRKFRIGDKVTVKLVAANLTKRQLDFEWVVKPELETIVADDDQPVSRTASAKAKSSAKPKSGAKPKPKPKKK